MMLPASLAPLIPSGTRRVSPHHRLGLTLAVVAAALTSALPLQATVVVYDFANLPASTSTLESTRTFTLGELGLTISAVGQDEDSTRLESEAVSFATGLGLGVIDTTDPLVSDVAAIDGNRGNEELIFNFSEDVTFLAATFTEFNPSSPAFDNDVFFLLNEGDFGDFRTSGNRIAFFNGDANGGSGNGNSQALPGYTFPANQAGPKSTIKVFVQDSDTAIYLSSLTIETDAKIPEPSTLMLLAPCFGFLLVSRRRRRKE